MQSAPNPGPLEAANAIGIPGVADHNGASVQGEGGCAIANMRVGRQQTVERNLPLPPSDHGPAQLDGADHSVRASPPKAIDWYVSDGQLVDGVSVIGGRAVGVLRLAQRVADRRHC